MEAWWLDGITSRHEGVDSFLQVRPRVSGHDHIISPEQASMSGEHVRDEDLPMLAAGWLAQGHDNGELWEQAGMTRATVHQLLAQLGEPPEVNPSRARH